MRIFRISQPWDGAGRRAGDYLIDLFQQVNPSYRQFKGIIAFLKEVGVAAIEPAARDFSARGGTLQFIIGIDLQGTSFQGLQRLLQLTPEVWVFNVPGSSTFHPKYYLFERQHHATVIIGSSNLTQGGLFRNFEVNLGVELNLRNREDRVSYGDLVAIWNQYFQLPTGNLRRLDQGLLTQLLQRGYLFDETVPQPGVTQAGARGGGTTTGTGLFPRLPVPGAPRLPARIRPTAAPVTTPLPTVSFLETVEHIDVSQAGGRSPDIFVPLRSINVNPGFWQWPQAYQLSKRGPGETTRSGAPRSLSICLPLHPTLPYIVSISIRRSLSFALTAERSELLRREGIFSALAKHLPEPHMSTRLR